MSKYFNLPFEPRVVAPDAQEKLNEDIERAAKEDIINFAAERADVLSTKGTGGHGAFWRPVPCTLSVTAGRDGVPSVDDNLDADPHAAPRVYPSWRKEDTYVVTRLKLAHPSSRETDKGVEEKFGPVLEKLEDSKGRYYRVYKPEKRPRRG